MDDLKDILSDEEQLNDDELIRYLEGNVSDEERNAFERKTATSSFATDAVEGLQQFKNKQQLQQYVAQLNSNLHKQLALKKQKKDKRKLNDNMLLIIATLAILAICIIGYFVIHFSNKQKTSLPSIDHHSYIISKPSTFIHSLTYI